MLIQGDSLSSVPSDVAEIRDACRAGDATGALESADLVLENLNAILLRYTDALDRHGLRKPF